MYLLGGCCLQIKDIPVGAIVELEVKYNGQCVNFQSEVTDVIENSVLINPIIVDEKTLGFSDSNQVNFIYISEDRVFVWDHIEVTLVKYNGTMYIKQISLVRAYHIIVGTHIECISEKICLCILILLGVPQQLTYW